MHTAITIPLKERQDDLVVKDAIKSFVENKTNIKVTSYIGSFADTFYEFVGEHYDENLDKSHDVEIEYDAMSGCITLRYEGMEVKL